MRETLSLYVIPELIKKRVKIKTFDPTWNRKCKKIFKDYSKNIIEYCNNEYESAKNSDALVILTEWNQFRGMD